jgi:hypothetical protein
MRPTWLGTLVASSVSLPDVGCASNNLLNLRNTLLFARGPSRYSGHKCHSAYLQSSTPKIRNMERLSFTNRINRPTTRCSKRALDFLSTSLVAMLGLAAASALSYADDHGGQPGDRDGDQHWVGTWGTSPEAGTTGFSNQTLRLIVHTSIGGNEVRVRLSNAYGTASLVIGAAHIALRSTGAEIIPGSDRVLTFSGESTIAIPPGALVVSDPVELRIPALGDLAISVYLPDSTGPATFHAEGKQTSYISPTGDFTGAIALPIGSTTLSSFFLTNVEVKESEEGSAIVTLGDSITDGTQSTPDANHRWPNFSR